jgi:hypothetical protein
MALDERPLERRTLPHRGSINEPKPDDLRNALGIKVLFADAGSPSLLPHRKPRLLNIPGVEVEIVHDDLGIRIRPVETSATELPPNLTHELGSMPTDALFKVGEDRTFEGLGVVRPWLP